MTHFHKTLTLFAATLLLAVLFSTSSAQAQDASSNIQARGSREGRQERGRQFYQEMKERLHLSPEQETQVRDIMKESGERGKALQEEYADDREMMQQAMKEQMTELHSSISAVLDDGQKEEFEKMIEERQEQRREERGQRGRRGGNGR